MTAATYDFTKAQAIEQGSVFTFEFTYTDSEDQPVNLTGFQARMQIRESVDSPDILFELTTGNGRITLGGLTGDVMLFISAEDTAAFDWLHGVYDLELVPNEANAFRLLQGKVAVSPEVTR